MRILKLYLLTVALSLLGLASCDLFTPKPEPGSRNYVWEIDTLYMPMNYISTVWGASPNNLWAMGAGGTHNDRLLHYNGTGWSTYTNEVIWCSGQTLFGFSEDDIWMGGQAGWLDHGAGIWHYDGIKWEQNFIYNPDETYHSIHINDIWGSSPDNVYACGTRVFFDGTNSWFKGFVLHYNGTDWQEIVRSDTNSQFLKIREEDDKVFVFSYGLNSNNFSNSDIEFYLVKNNEIEQIYSNKESVIDWAGLNSVNGKVYFIIDNNVFNYKNGVFNEFLSINMDNLYRHVCGRNKNDLFIPMSDGIVHYNGTDMEYIYQLPSTDMRFTGEPLVLERDIYYCISYPGENELILHGKLEE